MQETILRPRVTTPKDVRFLAAKLQDGQDLIAAGSASLPKVEDTHFTNAQPAAAGEEDAYLTKVIKYIPVEVVAAYTAGVGIISGATGVSGPGVTVLWIWVAFLCAITVPWIAYGTRRSGQPIAWYQAVLALVAFVVWVFALGGPFRQFSWYQPSYGSLGLIAVTLVAPLLEKVFVK